MPMPMHEMFRISNQGCQLRDLVSTFCSRSPCLPRDAPSLMIPTDYGANIESWEGQHRHKETQGRPTWTHRWPTQTQAYNRNTGKEIQTRSCRHKYWICFRVILILFSMQTISAKIIAFVFFRNCFGASVMHCSKASVGNCSSTSVEMSNCQLFRPDLIFRLPSQPRASVNTTKCH